MKIYIPQGTQEVDDTYTLTRSTAANLLL